MLKKDANGIRRYKYVKEYIAEHKDIVIGLLSSLFLLFLLLKVSLVSSNRLDQLRSANTAYASMVDTTTHLEEKLLQNTIHYNLMVSDYESRLNKCSISIVESTPDSKDPIKKSTSRKFITRELVMERLKHISY